MHPMTRWPAAIVAALATLLLLAVPSLAHGGRDVSGYEIEVGFLDEPVYVGESSGLELHVADSSDAGVEGLEATLQAEVRFEDRTRALELSPVPGAPGEYRSVFIPTAAGPYTFRIYGTIEDTAIDEAFTSGVDGFDEVREQAGGQFPVQLPGPADVARDAAAGAEASERATLGLVLGGAGLIAAVAALGVALANRRRAA